MGNWGKFKSRNYSDTLLKRKSKNEFYAEENQDEVPDYTRQEKANDNQKANGIDNFFESLDKYIDDYVDSCFENLLNHEAIDDVNTMEDGNVIDTNICEFNFNDAYQVADGEKTKQNVFFIKTVMKNGFEALKQGDFGRFRQTFSSKETLMASLALFSYRNFIFEEEWNQYAFTYVGMIGLFMDDPEGKIVTKENPAAVHMMTRAVVCLLISVQQSRGLLENENTQKIAKIASFFQSEEDFAEMLNQAFEIFQVMHRE